MSEETPTPRRHRRGMPRSVAACQRCRRRKQKCDGKVPICGTCAAVGASCVMSDRLVVQQTTLLSECTSLRSQLATAEQRGDELAQKCHQLELQIMDQLNASHPIISGIPSPGPSSTAQRTTESFFRPARREGSPENELTSRFLRPTFSIKSKTKCMNGSAISSAWELWGDDTDIEVPLEPARSDLDRDTYLSLANTFFERRWPYLPVLHKRSFFEKHLNPYLMQSDVRDISSFLVNMVCAIASTEYPSHNTAQKCHRVFFREATKDIHLVMSSENLECIQCLLLLCMYGHNEPQSVNMWYTTGLALNLAVGNDLHRKESIAEQDNMSSELLKRVFWGAYVMSCNVAINLGRPLGIQESDIDMPLPLQVTDDQLEESVNSPHVEQTLIPSVKDTSTFIHIIKLRRLNAAIYRAFHSVGSSLGNIEELNRLREGYFVELNQWLITAPRYVQSLSTFQSTEWFQIAFHHAVLSLYRPSRAISIPSLEDLRISLDSSIGLISSYSALYARNRIKYTFVAIHSLFMAAVTMLYSLRAYAPLRRELSKEVIRTNITTFLTIFRGICDGRQVGEKCCDIIERLGNTILSLFENEDPADLTIDTEFQTWFGLQINNDFHTGDADQRPYPPAPPPHFPDVQVDLPWTELFREGIDMGTVDAWNALF